jgi:hypothetical protein
LPGQIAISENDMSVRRKGLAGNAAKLGFVLMKDESDIAIVTVKLDLCGRGSLLVTCQARLLP